MADILIRGMEMPKSCDECRLFNESWCMALSVENWRKSYNKPPEGGRLPDCPLVPLPEGHGRLGDLDALSKEFERLAFLDWNQKAAPYSWAYAYSEAQAAVDDSPTIVPSEGGGEDG